MMRAVKLERSAVWPLLISSLMVMFPRAAAASATHSAVPWTPKQLAADYFVVMYSDSTALHLAGFPMSDAAYQAWEQEGSEFHRERRNGLLPKR